MYLQLGEQAYWADGRRDTSHYACASKEPFIKALKRAELNELPSAGTLREDPR